MLPFTKCLKLFVIVAPLILHVVHSEDLFSDNVARDYKPVVTLPSDATMGGYPTFQGGRKWRVISGSSTDNNERIKIGKLRLISPMGRDYFAEMTLKTSLNQGNSYFAAEPCKGPHLVKNDNGGGGQFDNCMTIDPYVVTIQARNLTTLSIGVRNSQQGARLYDLRLLLNLDKLGFPDTGLHDWTDEKIKQDQAKMRLIENVSIWAKLLQEGVEKANDYGKPKDAFAKVPPISELLMNLGITEISVPAGDWIADLATGCRVWNLYPKANEAIAWSGACQNGMANGSGTLQWYRDGHKTSMTTGEFVEGKLTGKGTHFFENGDHYEGDFVDFYRTGKGTLIWSNGLRYEGNFFEGRRTGLGVLYFVDGNRYEGEFLNNRYSGKGTHVWANGDRNEFNFAEGNAADINPDQWVKLCSQASPAYPIEARQSGIVGKVEAQAIVENGVVKVVQILSGHSFFHRAVSETFMQYKCPAVVAPTTVKQTFNFKLE